MTTTKDISTSTENLRDLHQLLLEADDVQQVMAALRAGRSVSVDGALGSSKSLLAAALASQLSDGTVVVVCPRATDVDDTLDDLELFTDVAVEPFPALQSVKQQGILRDEAYGDRLRVVKQLIGHSPSRMVVTDIQALMQFLPTRSSVANQSRPFQVGKRLDVEDFSKWLASNGYHHTSAVELPGEFSVRGGIIDVFAVDWLDPVRMELFDDEVESIRRFSVSTQRSLMQMKEIEVTVLQNSKPETGFFGDFLAAGSCFVLVEPEQLYVEANQYMDRLDDINDTHTLSNVIKRIESFGHLSVANLATDPERVSARLAVESVERFSGDISRVSEELERVASRQTVHVVTQTDAEVKRLKEIFASSPLMTEKRLHFPLGRLASGFRLVSHSTLVISGADLFHRADVRRLPRRRESSKPIDSFMDLREGDLVVHLSHGIGRYRGLKILSKENHSEEHLEIEFKGGTKIYVPAAKIDLVQKYVGGRKASPRLATIGGKSWVKQKEAAAAAVIDLASEMLDFQAERAALPGFACNQDSHWQLEFDASFPYHETPDQLTAIDAIKDDMEITRPMDRLLCGDVGFGKTEMAMRAAFKAVDNGHQVAVLVPTTILAEQHFRSFSERMAEFPFVIGKLSRFCSAAEQRETVKELAAGNVDIVIGTHRLASKDVKFNNLGLLIIDEEQRFGVEVKDRLKTIRSNVDVLTMTATPIPRTLHLSLTGIRDISNLETPPEDRVAVETRVTRWNDELIRNSVLRELNRGGQVYFVHNRVHDMAAIEQRLKMIVPEARLGIGHGQMPERDLERVMLGFINHEFDLLLATTIVESGLDIPNANTMFIDEADHYGLSDLHQLRGRVGRYKHRAYCYLLIDAKGSVTPNAARRLRAIEEFSEMGAGFAIAMRDLEIRGAGNVLGTQQSGHIATVGYEMYCQLLEAAVRRLRSMPPKLRVEVNIDLPGEGYFPPEYVSDIRSKISLYRRLVSASDDQALQELREEVQDRFGKAPAEVELLFRHCALKIDAAVWQIRSIHIEDNYLVFGYADRSRAEQLVRQSKMLRIVDEESIYLTLPAELSDPSKDDAMKIVDLIQMMLRLK